MLEGDAYLQTAEETGYRLCYKPDSSIVPATNSSYESSNQSISGTASIRSKSYKSSSVGGGHRKKNPKPPPVPVFSVTWDSNPTYCRVFVCLHNGELKIIDFERETINTYHIYFRRFLSSSALQSQADHPQQIVIQSFKDEKLINLHWDKISTIPNRPHELMFVLGVSNHLMYTSIPMSLGSDPITSIPLLSQGTRGDLPGYVYGTPVLQFLSHPSRITSMHIHPNGQLLGTGDETGSIRIVVLISPQQQAMEEVQANFTFTNPLSSNANEPSTTAAPKTPGLACSPKQYMTIQTLHTGPIFALQWVDVVGDGDIPSYGCLTGSIDRAVRLWRVIHTFKYGITIEPCMVFDTFSTHILHAVMLLRYEF